MLTMLTCTLFVIVTGLSLGCSSHPSSISWLNRTQFFKWQLALNLSWSGLGESRKL